MPNMMIGTERFSYTEYIVQCIENPDKKGELLWSWNVIFKRDGRKALAGLLTAKTALGAWRAWALSPEKAISDTQKLHRSEIKQIEDSLVKKWWVVSLKEGSYFAKPCQANTQDIAENLARTAVMNHEAEKTWALYEKNGMEAINLVLGVIPGKDTKNEEHKGEHAYLVYNKGEKRIAAQFKTEHGVLGWAAKNDYTIGGNAQLVWAKNFKRAFQKATELWKEPKRYQNSLVRWGVSKTEADMLEKHIPAHLEKVIPEEESGRREPAHLEKVLW